MSDIILDDLCPCSDLILTTKMHRRLSLFYRIIQLVTSRFSFLLFKTELVPLSQDVAKHTVTNQRLFFPVLAMLLNYVMGCGQKRPVQRSGQAFKRKLPPLFLLSPTLQVRMRM